MYMPCRVDMGRLPGDLRFSRHMLYWSRGNPSRLAVASPRALPTSAALVGQPLRGGLSVCELRVMALSRCFTSPG